MKLTYINLDSATARRSNMENQLANLELTGCVERFSAVASAEGQGHLSPGEVGCFRSHIAIISKISELSGELSGANLILEDDVVLEDRIKEIDNFVNGLPSNLEWDIIFCSYLPDFLNVRLMMTMCEIMNSLKNEPNVNLIGYHAKGLYCYGTQSYIVNPNRAASLSKILSEHLHSSHPLPIDHFYKHLIETDQIKALCLFPFLAYVDLESTSGIASAGRLANPDDAFFPHIVHAFSDRTMAVTASPSLDEAEGFQFKNWRERLIADAIFQRMTWKG